MGRINFINDCKKGTQFFVDIPEELECGDEICKWLDDTKALMVKTLMKFGGNEISENAQINLEAEEVSYFFETSNAIYGIVENHDCNFAISVDPVNGNISKYAIHREIISLISALQEYDYIVSKWEGDYGTKELEPMSELNEEDLDDILNNTAFFKKNEERKLA